MNAKWKAALVGWIGLVCAIEAQAQYTDCVSGSANTRPWVFVADPDNPAGAPVTTTELGGAPFQAGDIIYGVRPNGQCVGRLVWDPAAADTTGGQQLTVFGSDEFIQGAESGEVIRFDAYDVSAGTLVQGLTPVYFSGSSVFGDNIVSTFSALTESDLPVGLSRIEAVADGPSVHLRWTTSSETDNAGFEVELAGPGDGFHFVAFVPGQGTTRTSHEYAYTVGELRPGTYRLRLRQLDHDGTATLSPSVEATVGASGALQVEAVHPNPFNPEAAFRFSLAVAVPVEVRLFDGLGREVGLLYSGTPTPGSVERVRLDGRGLPSGVYHVRMLGPGIRWTEQVVLVN